MADLGVRAYKRQRIPSRQQVRVLRALLDGDAPHGYDIMKAVGVGPGTLYGLLKRLHDEGYLGRRNEIKDGRNRVRYHLTERGLAYAERALTEAELEEAMRQAAPETP